METPLFHSLLIAVIVGFASGSIGAFIILRRMALVGDALSHVALPGIGVALLYGIDPFWGVLASLLLASVIIWRLEITTKLPAEALVGILFTASLATGILLIPEPEIIESLFGEFPFLSLSWLATFLITGISITLLTFYFAREFLFSIVSPDLAQVGGVARKYNLLFFLLFAVAVSLGIKLVGTLLMGALTVIPASIAKNTTRSMSGYMMLSAILGSAISVIGVLLASFFGFLPGPTIILTGIVLFITSLLICR